uniref:Uncharacterized protein n=1 Tax=Oryzias melastigma TaxID=30732 RepID=A0A3B3CY22_ORYME
MNFSCKTQLAGCTVAQWLALFETPSKRRHRLFQIQHCSQVEYIHHVQVCSSGVSKRLLHRTLHKSAAVHLMKVYNHRRKDLHVSSESVEVHTLVSFHLASVGAQHFLVDACTSFKMPLHSTAHGSKSRPGGLIGPSG